MSLSTNEVVSPQFEKKKKLKRFVFSHIVPLENDSSLCSFTAVLKVSLCSVAVLANKQGGSGHCVYELME